MPRIVQLGGGAGPAVTAVGNAGAARTVTLSSGREDIFTLTLNAAALTVTWAGLSAGASWTMIVTQDATGGRTISWPAATKFPGGAPGLSPAAAAVDVLTFFSPDGTAVYGFFAGPGMA